MRTVASAIVLLVMAFNVMAAEKLMPDKAVTYKIAKDKQQQDVQLEIDVFYPSWHQATDRRPAIVFFFGGGWNSGTPEQFYPHCSYFASRGMVAMSAEYRVKNRHGTSPRQCVEDGKSAIRWIRQNAEKFGIDVKRLAAGGGSAGGHVAAATGTVDAFEDEATGTNASPGSLPNALVLFNPVFDNGPEGYGHQRVKNYWKEFSPLHNINANTPPTIVFLGTKDKLVPVATAKLFQQRMIDAGGRCELHLYEDQPHGFFNHRNKKYYTETVIAADRFLASLGFLEGEPTLTLDDVQETTTAVSN